ncbi:MAG: NepR family anti-sigma factor [Erythrobacter sp.]
MTDEKREKREKLNKAVAFDPVEAALKQMFDDVASEEVPEDFADLIAKLSDKPLKGEK